MGTRSRTYEISCSLYPLPAPYKQPVYVLYNCLISISYKPEDGHFQARKHVVVPYVENTLYSTNKYSCVRRVHALYSSYFIEHNGDDEPYDYLKTQSQGLIFLLNNFPLLTTKLTCRLTHAK